MFIDSQVDKTQHEHKNIRIVRKL